MPIAVCYFETQLHALGGVVSIFIRRAQRANVAYNDRQTNDTEIRHVPMFKRYEHSTKKCHTSR